MIDALLALTFLGWIGLVTASIFDQMSKVIWVGTAAGEHSSY